MSSAARDEAIDIVTAVLEATLGKSFEPRDLATEAVDKLDETFAISRRTPRVHKPSSDERPKNAIDRAMAGGSFPETESAAVYPTGAPRSVARARDYERARP